MNSFGLFLALASIGLAITDAKPVEGKKPGKKSSPVSTTEPKSISVASSSFSISSSLPEEFGKWTPEVQNEYLIHLATANSRTATSKVPPPAKPATKSAPPAKPEEGEKPGKKSAPASKPEPEVVIVETSISSSSSNNGNKDSRPTVVNFPDGFDKWPAEEKKQYLKLLDIALGRTATSKGSSPPNNPDEPKPVQKGRTAMSNIKAKPMEVTKTDKKSAPAGNTEPATSSSTSSMFVGYPDGFDKLSPEDKKQILNVLAAVTGRAAMSKIPPPAKTATKSALPEEGKKPGKKSALASEPESEVVIVETSISRSSSNNGKKDNSPITLPEGFDKLSPEQKDLILSMLNPEDRKRVQMGRTATSNIKAKPVEVTKTDKTSSSSSISLAVYPEEFDKLSPEEMKQLMAAVDGRAAMSKVSSPPNNPAFASSAGEVVDEAEQKARAQAWAKLKAALETYLQKRGKGGQQGRGVIISTTTTAPKIQGRRASAPVKKDASKKVIQATNRGFPKKKP